jgi:MoaA/NifB/PqqE/SkfB family radical SAM enzyme
MISDTAFDYNLIDEYQIEITSYCNAACPQCPRNDLGHGVNPFMPLEHLDRNIIDRSFPAELCKRLRQVFFCGSYGDPIMHPKFLDILQDFRDKNPNLWLYAHTNGGAHDVEYWRQVAKILGNHGQIDFGIDGLKDTLSIYRRRIDFDKVMENCQAFIDSGGRAQWNFIVFRHNQHQIEAAKALSNEMGFFNFLARRTGRFFDHANEVELNQWPVKDQGDKIAYYIEPPTVSQWRNASTQKLPELKKHYPNLQKYFSETTIRCDAVLGKKVAINVIGLVLPCNFFNHNLYDARFHSDQLPGRHALHSHGGKNQIRDFLETYGLDNINIHYHDLEKIFQNPMWSDLVMSWNKPLGQGRLFECAMTCGEKFTKVWDQGGNQR